MKNFLRRFPFTLTMLLLLGLTAILTNTHTATLSSQWMERLGFAPVDLLALDLGRLITSALVTIGGRVFWEALAWVTFSVGLAEWFTGTRRAALTFWGVHLAALTLESLVIALPLHWVGMQIGTLVALSRDVGPSAGYFGALGLVTATLKKPWHWIVGGLIFAIFVWAMLTVNIHGDLSVELSADLAHLIAFPLGWLSLRIGAKKQIKGTAS